jgi:cytochrome c oxidase subunit 4
MSGHISPTSTYLTIFGALMVCTILTVVAAFINMGNLNFPVALTIAVFKATLVVLFFMHIKYGSSLTKLIVGTAFFFLGIMLTLTMADYLSRGWFTAPGGTTGPGAIVRIYGPSERVPPIQPVESPSPNQNPSPK